MHANKDNNYEKNSTNDEVRVRMQTEEVNWVIDLVPCIVRET